ncbi:MAG TPA: putative sugar nucleotidyl transferase [Gemmatimonadaceae bacterium]|nr:putative sugar nucleotidyl transferase [Gemmatimonadaceae bacterium]
MIPLFIYDDARARRFEPFALTRPAGSLATGVWPVWLRWQVALQCPAAGFVGAPHLDGFDDGFTFGIGTTPGMAAERIPAGSIIASGRFLAAAEILALRGGDDADATRRSLAPDTRTGIWRAGGRVAALRTSRELDARTLRDRPPELETLAPEAAEEEVRGWWIDEVWDLVRLLPEVLADDLLQATRIRLPNGSRGLTDFGPPPDHATVLGSHPVLVGAAHEVGTTTIPAATVEPHVVLDATAGPIMIEHGAHVHAHARLTGPCYIGTGSTVLGGDIATSSIGPMCKVRGEMSHTIMLGYANKGHDGFVGHSVLGRWSNLGAGTITSNLKNTYGSVSLWTPDGLRDTGLQFLGTLFGDHAKTGIGTRLTTGSVLGAGANAYGSAMPPKAVPPFAWGERPPYATYRLDKFLEVASRVMARRKCALSDGAKAQLAAAWEARWSANGGAGG